MMLLLFIKKSDFISDLEGVQITVPVSNITFYMFNNTPLSNIYMNPQNTGTYNIFVNN